MLKLGLTPILIGGASLAARRWGPSVGGWLVALPLTSGPVAFFLAVDVGTDFASRVVVGSLGGLAAIAAFCLVYALTARGGPARAVAAGSVAFAVVGIAIQPLVGSSVWAVLAVVIASVGAVFVVLPATSRGQVHVEYPWWDIPARMIVATALVVGLTELAPALGPAVSGVVATFPVYLSVLAIFAHVRLGPGAAIAVLRGLLAGLFGTAAFFVVVHLGLVPLGVVPAFAGATGAALAIQAVALRTLRPPARAEPT
ncbi:MAG TPA: hypothetical protein VIV06_11805 [Candidatus Limnocylindrales bacterium]